MSPGRKEWHHRYFSADYWPGTRETHGPEDTRRDVAFILTAAKVRGPARFLDACCGQGRHALELARLGHEVAAVDLSRPALAALRKALRRESLPVTPILANMQGLRLRRRFDVALCMQNSLGYGTAEEDAAILGSIARHLKPGGTLVLDLPNRERVFRDARHPGWRRAGGGYMLGEHEVDLWASRVSGTETRILPDGTRREFNYSLRVYSLPEMASLLAHVKFGNLRAFGDVDGSPYDVDAPRLVLTCTRSGGRAGAPAKASSTRR